MGSKFAFAVLLVACLCGALRAQTLTVATNTGTNLTCKVGNYIEIGETAQLVEVTSFALVLQTDSTQTGETLHRNNLTSLPLNGRNFSCGMWLYASQKQGSDRTPSRQI